MDRAAQSPGPALTGAALLVAGEGGAMVLAGIAYALAGVLAAPEDRLATVLGGALALVAGLLVLAVARGLRARRAWAWSPTVVAQMFLLVIAYGLVQGRVWAVAVPLLLAALGVLGLLLTPAARAAFRDLR